MREGAVEGDGREGGGGEWGEKEGDGGRGHNNGKSGGAFPCLLSLLPIDKAPEYVNISC